MKILQLIHGYPPRYSAGSEVYTQLLTHALISEGQEVKVFSRQENAFLPEYALTREKDPLEERVEVILINMARTKDRYQHTAVDDAFDKVLEEYNPDILHIGHLNHLSTSVVKKAADKKIPIVFTLHDFWLMCPRGQFLRTFSQPGEEPDPLCARQIDHDCALACYSKYFTGDASREKEDIAYWTSWTRQRMEHIREMVKLIDLFIAPSKYLLDRFVGEFGLPKEKTVYLDYGFNLKRLEGRIRAPEKPFVFGYIGTHKQAKGIHHLIQAFAQVKGKPLLRIWGGESPPFTSSLKTFVQTLPKDVQQRIEWKGGYANYQLIEDVFNHVDAIVVPSIWGENSPLVIHEALQCRIPVITANFGGMAEYVKHEYNGLLFEHRNPHDLAQKMERLAHNPELAKELGQRGYHLSEDGNIPDITSHARTIIKFYEDLRTKKIPGPWRITFDTNPDDCNLHCIMCEEHSIYSQCQTKRKAEGRPRRRMDIALIRKVLSEAKGSPLREIIPSTMGEPLLYRDFPEILNLCREFGVKLNLTTNGTFPGKGATKWGELIIPLASDVKISWNGASKATQELIMIGTSWEKVLQNVKDFIRVRDTHAALGGSYCRVTFQMTFLEHNVSELADIVRLAIDLGVNRVKGHHLWVFTKEMESQSMRRNKEAIRKWNIAVEEAYSVAENLRLPSGEKILLENIFPLSEDATEEILPEGVCPFLGKEAWVSAEGRFGPCCAPNEQRKTLGDFGNLYDRSIAEIFASPQYLKLQENYLQYPVCKGCNMRKKEETYGHLETTTCCSPANPSPAPR
ncbi:MAG: glycosyltransferase [Verrucomicrobia bacterium]|nr:glycosyltransferase [Verrucomicrobiota bacterium]